MIGVPVPPRRVFGVALSAAGDAGDRTWVCRATPGADGIRVESVDRLVDLPGGIGDRAGAYRALVAKVLEAPRSVWGFDAPFGTAEKPSEPRKTDTSVDPPVTGRPSDLAAVVQRLLLDPLQGHRPVVILPIDALPVLPAGAPPAMVARAPSTYVLEVGPERVLGRLASESGSDALALITEAPGREAVLRELVAAAQVRPLARALRTRIGSDPRAFDALLCAVAAWRGYRTADHGLLHADPAFREQGYRYA